MQGRILLGSIPFLIALTVIAESTVALAEAPSFMLSTTNEGSTYEVTGLAGSPYGPPEQQHGFRAVIDSDNPAAPTCTAGESYVVRASTVSTDSPYCDGHAMIRVVYSDVVTCGDSAPIDVSPSRDCSPSSTSSPGTIETMAKVERQSRIAARRCDIASARHDTETCQVLWRRLDRSLGELDGWVGFLAASGLTYRCHPAAVSAYDTAERMFTTVNRARRRCDPSDPIHDERLCGARSAELAGQASEVTVALDAVASACQ